MLQQGGAGIPRHGVAAANNVVPFERADRHALHGKNFQPLGKSEKVILQAQKDFLLVADQVHLVDCH